MYMKLECVRALFGGYSYYMPPLISHLPRYIIVLRLRLRTLQTKIVKYVLTHNLTYFCICEFYYLSLIILRTHVLL